MRLLTQLITLVALAALLALPTAHGEIVDMSVAFEELGLQYPVQHMGMYSKMDSPWGDDHPFVQLRGVLVNKSPGNVTLLALMVRHDEVGHHEYPCDNRNDKPADRTLVVYGPGESPLVMNMDSSATLSTDWYHVYVVQCDGDTEFGDDKEPVVTIEGEVVSRNTFGYIPAEKYHLLPYFGILCLIYMVVGTAWAVVTVINWQSSLYLQHCIAVVIALGFWEMVFRYFDLWAYNKHGRPNLVVAVIGILFNASKETLSRMLVLAVSMGYGVVKPSLGNDKYKVYALGAVFFVVDSIYSINLRLGGRQGNQKPSFAFAVAVIVPQSLANALFFYWTFIALAKCMHHLEKRRQFVKLSMYKTFSICLGVALGVSLLLMTIHGFVEVGTTEAHSWRYMWIFEAYWELIYFAVLLVVCAIWRPSVANMRYAYQQPAEGEPAFDEESTDSEVNIPLAGITEPLNRNSSVASGSAGGPPPPSRPQPASDPSPRTATSLFTAAAFALHEDDGETEALEENKME